MNRLSQTQSAFLKTGQGRAMGGVGVCVCVCGRGGGVGGGGGNKSLDLDAISDPHEDDQILSRSKR